MESYRIKFMPDAETDLKYFRQLGSQSVIRKIERLILELELHPSTGTGQVEQLRGNLTGMWSRRITDRHRIVYRIDEDEKTVVIYQMRDHYTK